MREPGCVLFTRDEATSDQVLAVAAALRVAVDVVDAASEWRRRWVDSGVVLVGADVAGDLAASGPPTRGDVFVVGFDAPVVARWSVPLGGQVLVLPDGAPGLAAVLGDARGAGGPVLAVLGGSGGVGASTLAAGLAMAAHQRGRTAALVDLDPTGGGVDLLLGAERTPGWRWPQLIGARGEVSDVRRFLPEVNGLTVVSMGRATPNAEAAEAPSNEAVRAVLGALARHHDLIVCDPGRAPMAAARGLLASCRSVLLLVGTSVRAVAAASAFARTIDAPQARVVVRPSAGSRVPAELVGQALGLPVVATVPDDPRLPRAAEDGEPPGRTGRGRWARAVDRLLDEVGVGA